MNSKSKIINIKNNQDFKKMMLYESRKFQDYLYKKQLEASETVTDEDEKLRKETLDYFNVVISHYGLYSFCRYAKKKLVELQEHMLEVTSRCPKMQKNIEKLLMQKYVTVEEVSKKLYVPKWLVFSCLNFHVQHNNLKIKKSSNGRKKYEIIKLVQFREGLLELSLKLIDEEVDNCGRSLGCCTSSQLAKLEKFVMAYNYETKITLKQFFKEIYDYDV